MLDVFLIEVKFIVIVGQHLWCVKKDEFQGYLTFNLSGNDKLEGNDTKWVYEINLVNK